MKWGGSMKLLLLAKSHLKKRKSSGITILILSVLAIFFSYIGLSVLFGINSFFTDKNKETGNGNVAIVYEDLLKSDDIKEFIGNNELVSKYVSDSGYQSVDTKWESKNKSSKLSTLWLNIDDQKELSKVFYSEKMDYVPANAIVLPYDLKVKNKLEIGDTITFFFGETKQSFIIYGFSEEVKFSSPLTGKYKIYIDSESYSKLSTYRDCNKVVIQNIVVDDTDEKEFINDFVNYAYSNSEKFKDLGFQVYSVDSSKQATGLYIDIIMVIILAFSIIMLIIALIMIFFTIKTFIDQNIQNFGYLQAIGYKRTEIIASLVSEFIGIQLASVVVALVFILVSMPYISNIVSSSVGLKWNIHFVPVLFVIISVIVVMVSQIIVVCGSLKIIRINPVIAMRCLFEENNFKKNCVSLSKGIFSLNMHIGLKSIAFHKLQSAFIFVIIFILSVSSVFGAVLYYNFVRNQDALIKMLGVENYDLNVRVKDDRRFDIYSEIANLGEVDKINYYNNNTVIVDNNYCTYWVCKDASLLNNPALIEGRNPIHDNEVAVGKQYANESNLELGDTISIKIGDVSGDFIIVGFTQRIMDFGKGGLITEEGMQRIMPSYYINSIVIYLKDNVNRKEFINELREKYSDYDIVVSDDWEEWNDVLSSLKYAMIVLCSIIILVTVLTVILLLYMILKIKIIKEKNNLIMRAKIGHTKKQIVSQMLWSILPVVVMGILLGGITGGVIVNKLMSVLFVSAGTGIAVSTLTIPVGYIIILCIALCITAYAISNLISRKTVKNCY